MVGSITYIVAVELLVKKTSRESTPYMQTVASIPISAVSVPVLKDKGRDEKYGHM